MLIMAKPELLDVDPSTLIIGTNVRRDAHADTLVSSLKSNGMLHPIRARRTDDGLEVIDGQRRTLAAITAGLAAVPVLVVDASDTGRVFEQYVSNEHREALTDADRVGTVKQLALMGLAAGTIAKRTGLTKTVVEQATAITDTTLELAPHGTLEDLAALASIEGQPEHAEAAQRLAGGDRQMFQSVVRRTAQRLAAEDETARIRQQHPDLEILESAPAYGDKEYLHLTGYDAPRLEHEDGTPIPSMQRGYNSPGLTLEEAIEHLSEALAIHVGARSGYGDAMTEIHFYAAAKRLKAAGVRRAKAAAMTSAKSPEQREKERAAKELTQRWADTADDRRAFLARLMQDKQPPKGWGEVVTTHMVTSHQTFPSYDHVNVEAARQILGLDQLDFDDESAAHDPQQMLLLEVFERPDRLPFAMLAIALVLTEEGPARGRDVPYNGTFATHGHLDKATLAYLDRLEGWGYDAQAERAVIAEAQP